MSKYFLITDLDGTLLPDDKILSETDKAAIRRFRNDGGKFSVATGRTLQSAQRYIDELQIDMPVILYNGSVIYDNAEQKVLYTDELPPQAENIALDLMKILETAGVEVLRLDNIYVVCNNKYEEEHINICQVTPCYTTFDKVPKGNWYKILFAESAEKIDEFEKYLEKHDFPVDFVRSNDIFIEMLPKNSSKGAALQEYIKLLNMDDITVIAAGDYPNDIEMLTAADFGAAPLNALRSVKDKADILLQNTSSQGAVAELIDRIYSGRLERDCIK